MRRELTRHTHTSNDLPAGVGDAVPAPPRHRRSQIGDARLNGRTAFLAGGGRVQGVTTPYSQVVGAAREHHPGVLSEATEDGAVGAGRGRGRSGGGQRDLSRLGPAPTAILADSGHPRSGIALPSIGSDVPLSVNLSGQVGGMGRFTAHVAEALLDGGIIKDSDWAGNLMETVNFGLRAALAQHGCEDLAIFDNLMLAWGDDTRILGLTDEDWYDRVVWNNDKGERRIYEGHSVGTNSRPIGQFSIIATPMADAFGEENDAGGVMPLVIGKRIARLIEAVGPAAGWRVCRVLNTALHWTGIATVPAMVRETPSTMFGWDDLTDAKEAEERDLMTTERFDRGQPVKACEWMRPGDPRLLRRAYSTFRRECCRARGLDTREELKLHGQDAWVADVLIMAAQLASVLDRPYEGLPKVHTENDGLRRHINHGPMFLPTSFPTHLLRWSTCDNIVRVFDDICENIARQEPTMVLYVQGFLLNLPGDGPGTLTWAVDRLRDTIEIIYLCDSLLSALHEMDPHPGMGGTGVWPRGSRSKRKPKQIAPKPALTLLEALRLCEDIPDRPTPADQRGVIQIASMADLEAMLGRHPCAL